MKMRPNSFDYSLWNNDEYASLQPYRQCAVFIDAGAHIGSVSVRYAPYASLIVAIEAHLENYLLLCANTASYMHILPLYAALYNQTGTRLTMPISFPNDQQLLNTGGNAPQPVVAQGYPVLSYSLTDIISMIDQLKTSSAYQLCQLQQSLDDTIVLKLDVEGYEQAILSDPAADRCTYIFGEYHIGTDPFRQFLIKRFPNHTITIQPTVEPFGLFSVRAS